MLVAPSPPTPAALIAAPSISAAEPVVVPPGLLDALGRVPDPRGRCGVRFKLATLLAVGVRAMTCAGHNSLTAIAEWARRLDQDVLARLGCPFDPFASRFRAPGERTSRDVFARVDPGALTAAGFARLAELTDIPAVLDPDGVPEREQRRGHRAARRTGEQSPPRRQAFAADGKCLRGAVRADSSRASILTAVRHGDALTAALREIGASGPRPPTTRASPCHSVIDTQHPRHLRSRQGDGQQSAQGGVVRQAHGQS